MIVRVWCESGAGWAATHVPVTPQTTCRDVLECCREPGTEPCLLLCLHPQHGVHVLRDPDLPLEVAAALGPDLQFVLKYIDIEYTSYIGIDGKGKGCLCPTVRSSWLIRLD